MLGLKVRVNRLGGQQRLSVKSMMLKTAALCLLALSLTACVVVRAVDYSFNAPEHEELIVAGHCYGVDDWPGDRLLITDCGGYVNLLISTISLGLAQSDAAVTARYLEAALSYLGRMQQTCHVVRMEDLGGRIFEVFYRCGV